MMSEEKLKALQDALDLKQKELDLIMAIDEIRDTVPEPAAMLTSIVNLLADQLEADLCLMFLLDRETGEAELKAISDRSQEFSQLQQVITRELAEQAIGLDRITIWEAREKLPVESLGTLPENLQLAAVPIIIGSEERLGALLLARSRVPLDPNDVQLLKTAEDQIDSAVMQGYLYDKHQRAVQEAGLKQKELDLMMAIDEIRDTVPEPAAMLASIVNLLADRLEADLCLMFLLDRETGGVELKAVSERSQEFGQLQQVITRELAEQAIGLDRITIWEAREKLPVESLADVPENLQLAAVPIIVGTENRLGVLLLARSRVPLDPNDVQLLKTAEDQIDSAVIQGYLYDKHQLSVKEVETIYQIDRIRDQGLSLNEMLNKVIQVLIAKINAEMGFIMLYDRAGRQLEMRATTHQDLFQTWLYREVIEQVVNESLQQAKLLCRNNVGDAVHSVMCLPLILNEQIIGVLGVVNRYGPHGFTAADCRLLNAIGSQIDTAIYERREIRRLRHVLGRSVDPRVMERLLASPDVDILKPERLELTVLYADIRGSTLLAEQTDPELLAEFIKDYLTQMTDVVLSHEGTVDKFVGDEVMALFGAPIPQKDHALCAVRVGLAMQAVHQTIMKSWQEREVQAPPIGIGIATGKMIVGEMGGSQRADYTVIGRDANLGARICDMAKGGQVLISEATYDLVKEVVEAIPLPGQQFKGVPHRDVTVYHVTRVLD
jgi:class 3 adenylate cyclase/GTP-sensing pleiotropic transcriptional regulator CodY